MTYRFIEEEATADVAFEAEGKDLAEIFSAAGDALINVMVDNLEAIQSRERRVIEIESEELDLLLVEMLQKLIFYKDAESLLMRVSQVDISYLNRIWRLRATGRGERIDPERHHLLADVKAVTLHDLRLEQLGKGWRAHVILGI
jgi:SHS2 domain-containing protein